MPQTAAPSVVSSCCRLLYCHGYSHLTCPGTQKTLSSINTPLSVLPQIVAPSVVSSCSGLLYCHGYSHLTCPRTQRTLSSVNTLLYVMPQIVAPSVVSSCPGLCLPSSVNTLFVMPQIVAPSVVSSCSGLLYCHGYSHQTCPGTQKTLSSLNTPLSVMPQIVASSVVSSCPVNNVLGFYTVTATVTRLVLEPRRHCLPSIRPYLLCRR